MSPSHVPGPGIEKVSAADAAPLGQFFEALAADLETARFFHPHPLTIAYATELCARVSSCRDLYFVARWRGQIAGYSLLRGWDEGYAIPSVGVCVHPALRNAGLGHVLMAHAVEQSRAAGAPRLRLSVYRENERGRHVWAKFGYVFSDKNEHELLGLLELTPPPSLPPVAVDVAKLDAWLEALERPVWLRPAG
jgi:ribosomal protein S18 acetylase RimI-like enzyme